MTAVLTALQGIGTANGDTFDPVAVQRLDRLQTAIGRLPALVLSSRNENWPRDQGGAYRVTLQFDVGVYIAIGENQPLPSDKRAKLAGNDVQRAISAIDWEPLKAFLAGLTLTTMSDIEENDPHDGAIVGATVEYALDPDDTFVVIDP